MLEEIIVAGFGGQGVLFLGQLMAYAGMVESKNVSWLPSYGPEMRGGTANCHVIISDEPVGSPVVTTATSVITLNGPAKEKFEPKVMKDGNFFINSSLVSAKAKRNDLNAFYLPANDIALELGNIKIVNMVMLGSFIARTKALEIDSIMEALKAVLGTRKEHLLPINKTALSKGMEYVS